LGQWVILPISITKARKDENAKNTADFPDRVGWAPPTNPNRANRANREGGLGLVGGAHPTRFLDQRRVLGQWIILPISITKARKDENAKEREYRISNKEW